MLTAKVRANWYETRGICRARYNELMWFARQYDDFKARDRDWRCGIYDRVSTGNTAGRGHSDPTAAEAMRLASSPWAWKIAAIEQAAAEAAPEYCQQLLANCTRDICYERMDVPCGRAQFYAARRRFFHALHGRLENR